MGKNVAQAPTLPRIKYMCVKLTRRSRCNSSCRCCCLYATLIYFYIVYETGVSNIGSKGAGYRIQNNSTTQ